MASALNAPRPNPKEIVKMQKLKLEKTAFKVARMDSWRFSALDEIDAGVGDFSRMKITVKMATTVTKAAFKG